MIEKAKQEDLEAIYSLICELEQEEINREHFCRTYNDALKNNDVFFLIYRHDNKVIGFLSLYIHHYLHHHEATGEIVELVVLPEYRSLKVGSRLLDYAEDIAKQKGLGELELNTSTYRKKAQCFYEAHGYLKNHYNYTKDIKII